MSEELQSPTSVEARGLVERMAASAGFQRSPRLRELLKFIVECSLESPGTPITEQQIGISIFHRPPQFDSSADTIVRVQISQLRKRIEHYYLTEGSAEPYVLEIPRGAYNATFQGRPVAASPAVAVPEAAALENHPGPTAAPRGRDWRIPLLLAAVAVLAVACLYLASRLWWTDTGSFAGPSVKMLWSNLLRAGQKTSVVVADSGFGFLQDALGAAMDLDRYLQHDPEQWVRAAHPDAKVARTLEMLAFRQYTSIGDLAVARKILNVNPALASQVSLVFARNYNARGPGSENVVLLGSQRSNPWVHLYLDRVNFLFDYDEASHKAIVRNRHPQPGESEIYHISGEGSGIKEGYAVMTFLPDPGRNGNVLMLAGTDMEATEAVGNLATTESGLAPVLAKVVANGKLPYFETLFKTRRLAGAPQECRLIAIRRMGN